MKSLAKSFSVLVQKRVFLDGKPAPSTVFHRLIASKNGRYVIKWGKSKAECVRFAERAFLHDFQSLNFTRVDG
jgi:hypothetical protein